MIFIKKIKLKFYLLIEIKEKGDIIEEVFVERNGKIWNYQIFDNEIEKQEKHRINFKDVKRSDVLCWRIYWKWILR